MILRVEDSATPLVGVSRLTGEHFIAKFSCDRPHEGQRLPRNMRLRQEDEQGRLSVDLQDGSKFGLAPCGEAAQVLVYNVHGCARVRDLLYHPGPGH